MSLDTLDERKISSAVLNLTSANGTNRVTAITPGVYGNRVDAITVTLSAAADHVLTATISSGATHVILAKATVPLNSGLGSVAIFDFLTAITSALLRALLLDPVWTLDFNVDVALGAGEYCNVFVQGGQF